MVLLLLACGELSAPEGRPPGAAVSDTGVPGGSEPGGTEPGDSSSPGSDPEHSEETGPDPFVSLPDNTEGLINVSSDLRALLEYGDLEGACDVWEADPDDREKMLLCGKWMFFYEAFETLGPPRELYDFYASSFPDTMGVGFEHYGLIPDPYSAEGRNLGMGEGAPMGDVDALAYTCASCHFAQLPDGRYAVGAPNYDYDYGRHTLALGILAQSVVPGWSEDNHNPDAIDAIRPELDALSGDWWLQMDFFMVLMGMLNIETEMDMAIPADVEGHYADWKTGTMDFLIAPLPLDDDVHSVHKILPLWGIPTPEQVEEYEMPSAMLSWTGGGTDLYQFLESFILIGGGSLDDWPRERLAPLVEYIYSLRPPENLSPPDASLAEDGRAVFDEAGCIDCHDGLQGSGREVFTFDEVGTDDALLYFADPDLDGVPCCDLDVITETTLTHGVKAPRITGVFWMNRLLHNGSVESLEELLCIGGSRTPITEPAFSNSGHTYGCDLSGPDKTALLAFLESI